ncbi:erythrocyte membrane antigen 1 [Plasmodium berghei]|uniref:Erythrocyte membrane antigen 1 n=2 Tax=Plasmodium berghei TaxID=5821 RepID=A0A509AG18_PLABA|nr:erythrocyte membrane antigen 1 [Plasmodium berghei ANKA]CXH16324.1 erythrocyte membrane antigen 1 [Plasmodium berghei]SBW38294.1 erythrocyte membrane antigen 1 [Plasmodium berghei]SCL83479.1 erythrocyte membrane antigen 1 [Plasmodium berghei]SCL85285.1 erythrocyte membrane antigen 1 [Plasmodium berghei]VUC54224.1 erythrocyte membrane antigen 1 [Plasmodium berghei ANKA]|eukprot:XP_034420061.1 erythrocyte membrane antigen 1 [Plasmodium berghei ANKA]
MKFGFCRRKSKKSHKTSVKEKKPVDPKLPDLKIIGDFDPIKLEDTKGRKSMLAKPFVSETDGTVTDKVTGSLIREKDSSVSEWYIRPYKDHEDVIMVNFVPLREYYQHEQQNVHNQYGVSPSVPKMSEKQKLSTINAEISNRVHDDDESTIYEDDASTILGNDDFTLNVDEEIDAELVSCFGDEENENE